MRCAVGKCKQSNSRKSISGKHIAFYTFPKDEEKRKLWVMFCNRKNAVNTQNERICALHFKQEDFERNLQFEMGFSNRRAPKLRPGAVPTIETNDIPNQTEAVTCEKRTDINEDSPQLHIKPLEMKIYTISNRNLIESSKTQPLFVKEELEETNEEIDKENGAENYNNFAAPEYSKAEVESYLNLNEDITPSQLQEPLVQNSCTGATQTNTRQCGLVQTSGYSNELLIYCFYCSEVFPLETWKMFVDHIKQKHFEREEAFKMLEYVSNDCDYVPVNLPSPTASALENIVIKTEPSFLEDPLETVHNSSKPENFSSTFFYGPDEYKINILNDCIETSSSVIPTPISETTNNLSNFRNELTSYSTNYSKNQKISEETALSCCLKRTDSIEVEYPQETEEYITVSPETIQQNCKEITFEYAPEGMVDLLLDSMKNYNVLWEFHNEPFNQDFYEAVEDICKIINDKYSLNIDNLKMRRSINRILRYYCYLYPNTNVENIDQFTNYYDKCATFLPSSMHEITYARCSHCYICYKNDLNLKQHLLKEHKSLRYRFKCVHCKECFREGDEYDLHKRLPHYREIFSCEFCNKRFNSRNNYNNHVSAYHPTDKAIEFKCNICGKLYQSTRALNNHRLTHGEKKVKCHLCPKKFYEKSSLSKHLKIHQAQYDYVCEVCGKAFICKNSLVIHMRKHTGAKVSCNICNLKLRSCNLKRHLRLMHNAYGDKPKENEMSLLVKDFGKVVKTRRVQPRRPSELNYKCKICKISFENLKLVVEHNKELHSDKPKWPCKMCSKEFAQSTTLKTHYRTKHNLHVIQAFKLVNKKEDLNVVLNIKPEFLNAITENLLASRNKPTKGTQKKSDELSEENYLETENIHSSTIQDEIMKSADNTVSQ